MCIGMGRESGRRGATGIVPVAPARWESDIGIFKAIFAFIVFLCKCKIASFRINRKRLKDKDNYYFEQIEHIEFQVEI